MTLHPAPDVIPADDRAIGNPSVGQRGFVEERSPSGTLPGPGGGSLTRRETEILRLRAAGKPIKVIEYELGISHSTVHEHLKRAYDKLDVGSTIEAFTALGWLAPPR